MIEADTVHRWMSEDELSQIVIISQAAEQLANAAKNMEGNSTRIALSEAAAAAANYVKALLTQPPEIVVD